MIKMITLMFIKETVLELKLHKDPHAQILGGIHTPLHTFADILVIEKTSKQKNDGVN